MPEGTVQCPDVSSDTHDEWWCYSAPYGDVVAFLQKQFATGRQYDSHGATYWRGLPPCYNANHQSPPWGEGDGDTWTRWMWSDGTVMLIVSVQKFVAVEKSGNGPIKAMETFDLEGFSCFRA